MQLREIVRSRKKRTEVTNLSFNCEKCEDDFHSLGALKKHLSKVHDVLVLEGKSKTCY